MKGNPPKLALAIAALVIAFTLFAVLRAHEFSPVGKQMSAAGGGSQTPAKPHATATVAAVKPATGAKPAVTGTPAREPASTKSPTDLFTELFRHGDWALSHGGDGRVSGLKGAPIPGATTDARSALAFARKLAEQLGANPAQLSEAHSQADTEHGLQTMYKYEQYVGDNPVFGGSMSVFSRRSDSAAYLVDSSLKPVDQPPTSGIDRAQAEAAVLAIYKDRGGKIGVPLFSDEYVYADQSPTELAWYFMVNVSSPAPMKLKVLFGASTRRVLYEAPALIN